MLQEHLVELFACGAGGCQIRSNPEKRSRLLLRPPRSTSLEARQLDHIGFFGMRVPQMLAQANLRAKLALTVLALEACSDGLLIY